MRRRFRSAALATMVAVAMAAVGGSPVGASAPDGDDAAGGAAFTPSVVAGSRFHPITPYRAWDSRTGQGPFGPVGPGATVAVTIAGTPNVPGTAKAVVMNVTVTNATAASYLVASPAGSPVPTAANLLFAPGQTVPNLVTVAVGTGGAVNFTNQLGSVDVIADVVGYYDDGTGDGDGFVAVTPARILDSRGANGGWSGPLGPGEQRALTVAGRGGVPLDATGVAMNVTVTGGTAASYLNVFPEQVENPGTANLLFAAGQTVPNLVVVALGKGPGAGMVAFYNQFGSVHVVADVVGYFTAGAGDRFHPLPPTRMLDDRFGIGLTGPWGPNQTRDLTVTGGVIPVGATGIVANVTATGGTLPSFLSVGPGGAGDTGTANLLFDAGQTVPNLVMTGVSGAGAIGIYNQQGSVHVIADVAGYFAAT